jgi:hypothetical protein
MSKKRKPLPPRRKRLKRAARLTVARAWLATFTGSRVVKSYARWFGVDPACALKELQILGVQLDPDHVAALQQTLKSRRRARRAPTLAEPPFAEQECDEYFAYIAGYTEAGFPYGVPWAEVSAATDAEWGEADPVL